MSDLLDRSRTPLLTLITEESLDRDYQVAASRRGPDPAARRPGSRTAVVLVIAVFAALVTVAALQTSRNAEVDTASRASLINRVEARRARVRALQEEIAALREANSAGEAELSRLGERLSAARTRRSALAALTGFEAVTGSGLRITVDNAALADETEQVRDSDLALLVDALWSAGAEAIAVNGRRLTARSAIRNSGPAIEVNNVGIAPPYTVVAIGDRGGLAAGFLESRSGQQFVGLANQYGFSYDLDNASDLRLPAAPSSLRVLRSAEYRTNGPADGQGGGTP